MTNVIRWSVRWSAFYRPGTLDLDIFAEQPRAYGLLNMRSKRVLDLGGHIGAFSLFALQNGAAEIFSYEPDVENFCLLARNVTDRSRCYITRAAVVPSPAPKTVQLYSVVNFRGKRRNTGSHSLQIQRGRRSVTVPAVGLDEALRTNPNVIKCDVEGEEYALLTSIFLPAHVQELAIELHLGRQAPLAFDLIAHLEAQGFKAVKRPRLEKNWYTIGVWKR